MNWNFTNEPLIHSVADDNEFMPYCVRHGGLLAWLSHVLDVAQFAANTYRRILTAS